MDMDKLISNSLKTLDKSKEIPKDNLDKAWNNIKKNKRKKLRFGFKFNFKEFAAVACFILLLILIPTLSSFYNKATKPNTSTISGEQTTNNQGNNSSSTTPNNTNKPSGSIADYYPFTENLKLTYTGIGMEYASNTTYVDYIKDNRIQLRVNNGGTIVGKVIEVKDGQIRLIASVGEFYYREDITSTKNNNPEILLEEPLVKGTSWTLPDGRKRYISNIDVTITTPCGTYKAIEVTTEEKDSKTLDYYAKGVGLVKTIFVASDNSQITTTLSKIEKNTPVVQQVRIFYGDVPNDKFVYLTKDLTFTTNAITRKSFEDIFKNPPSKNFAAISANTKINSLYLSTKDQMVYVDFSKELVTEMNAGTSKELAILNSITCTLGTYYNVNKVYITVDGNPYASGHIAKAKGEPFIVDTKNAVEYNQ